MMKKTAILAIGLTALAVTATACAPNYYGRDNYRSGYADRDRDGIPNRYDRDRDGDGVPNYADRRPGNPYRN